MIKINLVQTDEKEQGERALLNLGHTFGHALETANQYSKNLLHGEAVIIGCSLALHLSRKFNLIDYWSMWKNKNTLKDWTIILKLNIQI